MVGVEVRVAAMCARDVVAVVLDVMRVVGVAAMANAVEAAPPPRPTIAMPPASSRMIGAERASA